MDTTSTPASMNTDAFKDCDIRGTYADQVNEDIFARVGREFGKLLAAVASAPSGDTIVIGGDGRNWGGSQYLLGANLLGRWFRKFFATNYDPLRALSLAKARLALTLARDTLINRIDRTQAARDALAFRAYYRKV